MSRFKVGEIAIYEYDPSCIFHRAETRSEAQIISGCECEIRSTPYFCDRNKSICYSVWMKGGDWTIEEHCLRKRRPPEQPADEDFREWFDKTIANPITEDVVRRTMANMARFAGEGNA